MCGLFGVYSGGAPVQEETIRQALARLNHRGPDQHDYWLSPDGKMGLGQTRLSLNDLSQIKLPIANENDTIKVIANAEIYNFLDLKKQLAHQGHQFRSGSDIEVLPHLYEEYGINFINKLRGEFAFIIWDEKQKYLFAVRDRFGIKPLYYALHQDQIYFSSEIPVLLKLKLGQNAWNTQAIYDYTHLSLPYSKNLFAGIHEVPPGHFLSIKNGIRNIQAYWDIDYRPEAGMSEQEAVEAIRVKLIEATSLRTQSDVPVGCYLSGGIDSSALLGLAAKHGSEKIEAFTLEFDHPMVNESEISKRTAEHAQVKLHTLRADEQSLRDHFASAVIHTCFPMPNTAGVARYMLSQFTRDQGCKAVLSGEGADEVFLGYWGAMIEASEDPRINTNFSLSPEEREALLKQLPLNRSPESQPRALAAFKGHQNHVPSWFTTQGYFNAKHRHLLHDSLLEQYAHYDPYTSLLNDLNIQNRLDHFDRVQFSSYTWIKSFFPNTMLNWIGDRAEMAHSIESRQPFLDHELFELVATIPTHLKIKNGRDKYLLREAVKPYVTEELYQRKKFMFQAPPLKMDPQSPLYAFIRSTILDGIDKVSVYDKKKVLAMITAAEQSENLPISERAELGYTLTSLASMVILADHYQIA